MALAGSLLEHLGREAWRIGDSGLLGENAKKYESQSGAEAGQARRAKRKGRETHLERNHLHERGEGAGGEESDVVVGVTHASKDWDDHEEDVGQSLDVKRPDDVCRDDRSRTVYVSERFQ